METSVKHNEPDAKKSEVFTDFVIGMGDGLTVPFALTAGLNGAGVSQPVIILSGVVAIAAGAIALGLGGYYTTKTELDERRKKINEQKEIVANTPALQKEEVKSFFADMGLSEEVQEQAAKEVVKDKEQWFEFMRKYEQSFEKTDPKRAMRSGINIAVSYIAGGIVPVLPYILFQHPATALTYSAIITLAFLFAFGWVKNQRTGMSAWAGALRATIISALAAGTAFMAARLIEN